MNRWKGKEWETVSVIKYVANFYLRKQNFVNGATIEVNEAEK